MKIRCAGCGIGVVWLAWLGLLCPAAGLAQTTMQLESSVVVVDAADREGAITLVNSSSVPMLLQSRVLGIDEDPDSLLLVTPPITRVDPGDTQMVRFILKQGADWPVERLRRATFEGIPEVAPGVVSVTVVQNIPVIIRPKGLGPNNAPWTLLRWRSTGSGLSVSNEGPYVVRMLPDLTVGTAAVPLTLPRSYILPGETVFLVAAAPLTDAGHVSFRPATLNGYLLEAVEATLMRP